MTRQRDCERPNRSIPQAERLGEEILNDAALGGATDDEYETRINTDGDEAGDEPDAGPWPRQN